MSKFYIAIKVFRCDELIEEGIIVNLPSKRRKWFKNKGNAKKFITTFRKTIKEEYSIEYEILDGFELEKYLKG